MTLPHWLIEAENWMQAVLFAAMLLSAAIYFGSEVRRLKWRFIEAYRQSKASFAATMLFAGMFLRTIDVAIVRHFQEREIVIGLEPWAPIMLIAASALIIWGAICWMRAVLPLRCWPGTWVFLALLAIGTGLLMALT